MRKPAFLSKAKQAGNILIATTISLGVIAIIQMGASKYMLKEARNAQGRVAGIHLGEVKAGLEKYTDKFNAELKNGTPITGVVDPMHPTVAELVALNLTSFTGSVTPSLGGGYNTEIYLSASPCGASCTVRGKVWLQNPILASDSTTQVDMEVLAAAVNAASKDGSGGIGYSLPANPTTISSAAGWTESNPDPTSRPGILMAATGIGAAAGSVDLTPYIKRDGTQPVTADFPMTGLDGTQHSITGALDITASGTGSFGKTLTNDIVVDGAACAPNGTQARNTAGLPFFCQGGFWRHAAYDLPAGTRVGTTGNLHLQSGSANTLYLNPWGGNTYVGGGSGGTGNMNANDVYIRALGRWSSQLLHRGCSICIQCANLDQEGGYAWVYGAETCATVNNYTGWSQAVGSGDENTGGVMCRSRFAC